MTEIEQQLFDLLQIVARKRSDGHVTIMRFTTNWRVGFDTPDDLLAPNVMHSGKTFAEAAIKALAFAAIETGYLSTVYAEAIKFAERHFGDLPRNGAEIPLE